MRRLEGWDWKAATGLAVVLAIVIYLALALSASAAIVGWGENGHGNLGAGYTGAPTVEVGTLLTSASEVATGSSNGYALEPDGTVRSWGGDNYGQDCDGLKGIRKVAATPKASLLTGAVEVAAGGAHVAVRARSGTVLGCGSSGYGQLCNGFTARGLKTGLEYGESKPTAAIGITDAAKVFVGGPDTAILRANGELVGCGQNKAGELGPPVGEHTTPLPIPHGCPVASVALGGNPTIGVHALILCTDGTVEALGQGRYGQLGTGSLEVTGVPKRLALTGVTALAAGASSSAAVAGGHVWTWGENDVGELGVGAGPEACTQTSGTRPCSKVPVQVPSLAGVEGVALGNGFAYAWAGGLGFSWGYDLQGELDLGSFGPPIGTPRQMATGAILSIEPQEHGAVALTSGESPPPLLEQQPASKALDVRWRDGSVEPQKWLIGWRPVTHPLSTWSYKRLDPAARSTTIAALTSGQPYEVRVHDVNFGARIVTGVPLA